MMLPQELNTSRPDITLIEPHDTKCESPGAVGTWHTNVGMVMNLPALPAWMLQADIPDSV